MRSIRAIFIKQMWDIIKNKIVLMQFIVFPAIAFAFTELIAKKDPSTSDTMFVTMFAAIFSGMTLLMATAGAIAEDRESKSLRFLIMAGVKPWEYLLGIGGVMMSAGVIVSLIFALLGGFAGAEFVKFMAVMLSGSGASILLGASVGMISKNQQAAMALGMPVSMIIGFTPMVSMFNKNVEKIFSIFYTQQINLVVNDFSVNMLQPLLIILINIILLMALFTAIYKKKGLRS